MLTELRGTCAPVTAAHAQSLPGGFVYLRDIDPTIIQDIRYATSNNFVGHPLAGYQAGECVVKREVGLRLKKIQEELARQKLSLKMFDCYRPTRAVDGHGEVVAQRQGDCRPSGATIRRSARRTCSASATSPPIPDTPPARRSISRWSI